MQSSSWAASEVVRASCPRHASREAPSHAHFEAQSNAKTASSSGSSDLRVRDDDHDEAAAAVVLCPDAEDAQEDGAVDGAAEATEAELEADEHLLGGVRWCGADAGLGPERCMDAGAGSSAGLSRSAKCEG